jgi:hypothetical protein
MKEQQEGQWVVPNPRIPRNLGLMNLIFGGILLLFGAGQAALTYYGPKWFEGFEDQIQEQFKAQNAEREAKIAELTEKLKAAKTEDEKKDFETQLVSLQKKPQLDPKLFEEAKGLQTDSRIVAYTYTEMATGVILNILMIVSGVGLLMLAEWARRLAVAVAWLKILRWVTIVGATAFVILPITTAKMQPMLQRMQVQVGGGPGGGGGTSVALMATQMQFVVGIVTTVASAVIAAIYPVFLIWFLTRPNARAACLAATMASTHRDRQGEPTGL